MRQSMNLNSLAFAGVLLLSIHTSFGQTPQGAPSRAALGVPDKTASATAENASAASEATFLQQLQQYYQDAKDAGTTSATSAAQWLGEQYETTTVNASEATSTATKWVTDQYNRAVSAGDTSAKNATKWVVDDIGKIGTWEYKIHRARGVDADAERQLNDLGRNRWECYAVSRVGKGESVFYFKRPHRSYLQQLPAKDLLRLAPLLNGAAESAAAPN